MVSWLDAILLGIVEGLTEFLPISSTGHLILAARVLHLGGEAVTTFEVVIQAGALVAVVGLYWVRLVAMGRGLLGADPAGRRLLRNLIVSFLPAAVVGVLSHRLIKMWLFSTWPVVAALAAGGVLMIAVDRWRPATSGRRLESITPREALLVGLAQCLALWPGTSRAMVTILAGLLLGFPATVATKFSFLLALPTLGAAALFDAVQFLPSLLREVTWVALLSGFVSAALVAVLAMGGFLRYLRRWGLAPFGWYRLGLAALVYWVAVRP